MLRSDISVDGRDGHQVERAEGGYVLKPRISHCSLSVVISIGPPSQRSTAMLFSAGSTVCQVCAGRAQFAG